MIAALGRPVVGASAGEPRLPGLVQAVHSTACAKQAAGRTFRRWSILLIMRLPLHADQDSLAPSTGLSRQRKGDPLRILLL